MKTLIVGDEDCSINKIVSVIEKMSQSASLLEKWTTFARHLNSRPENIKKWKQDLLWRRQTVLDVIVDMLSDWRSTRAEEAKFEYLLDIFENEWGWEAVEDNLWRTFTIMTENTSWDDLDMRSRRKIMESQVEFQGQMKSIKYTLRRFNETEVHEMMQTKLLGAMILKLMRGEHISLLSDLIPETPSYYIPRMLNSRRKLNAEIFRNNCSDVFVIEGITPFELSEIAGIEGISKSSVRREKLNCRFILMDVPHGFEIVTRISIGVPVHHLRLKNGDYLWVKSSESVDLIQEYIDSDQDSIPEDEFFSNLHEDHEAKLPVCIADIPGMGKTCLLANLAQQRRCNGGNENMVFFIALPKFLDTTDGSPVKGICKDSVCSMISEYVSENELGQEIVAKIMQNGLARVEIFFDAFDELPSDKQEFTTDMIKCLLAEFKHVYITLSTRVHKRHELEQTLKVLSYNMQSFNHEGQVKFLERYWNKNCGVPIDVTLQRFSDFVAFEVEATLHSYENDVVGVPLQCSILADIYTDDAVRYSQTAPTSFELSVNISSILDMYAALMAKRFSNCDEKKRFLMKNLHVMAALDEVLPGLNSAKKLQTKDLPIANLNEINSIGILFGEIEGNSVRYRFLHHTYAEYILAVYWVDSLENEERGSENILESVSTENFLPEALRWLKDESVVRVNTIGCPMKMFANFLQKSEEINDLRNNWETLGEKMRLNAEISEIKSYDHCDQDNFLDLLLMEWTQCYSIQPKLSHFSNALRSLGFFRTAEYLRFNLGVPTFKQKSLCFFIDSCLQHKSTLVYTKIPTDFHNFSKLLTMLRACLHLNFYNLFKLISRHCRSMKGSEEFSSVSESHRCCLIVCAVMFASSELVSECCDFVEFMEDCTLCEMSCFKTLDTFEDTPLHFAVARGDFTIFYYLFEKYGTCMSKMKGLLHDCVQFSSGNSDHTISEKIQIIHRITIVSEDTINEIVDGVPPILCLGVHFKLLQCMIDIGADINITDEDNGSTVLHIAAQYLKPLDFHLFSENLLRKGHKDIFMACNLNNDTPINCAVFFNSIKLETIKLLSLHLGKRCLNVPDVEGRNTVFNAVGGGRKRPVLEMLVECGGDSKRLMKKKRGIVHQAAMTGNADAISYFVSLGCRVNARDADGCTPLHLVFRYGYRNIEATVQMLLANGVNVNIKDKFGHKAIWYAQEKEQLSKLEQGAQDILLQSVGNESEEVPFYRKLLQRIACLKPEL